MLSRNENRNFFCIDAPLCIILMWCSILISTSQHVLFESCREGRNQKSVECFWFTLIDENSSFLAVGMHDWMNETKRAHNFAQKEQFHIFHPFDNPNIRVLPTGTPSKGACQKGITHQIPFEFVFILVDRTVQPSSCCPCANPCATQCGGRNSFW